MDEMGIRLAVWQAVIAVIVGKIIVAAVAVANGFVPTVPGYVVDTTD
ncbi:hypothetical protein SNOG_15691 [Parastagonospora nodorum SN15]|uniref:Uncharacterized protein n=1 Tax=Phaeosphaeria nodorum (strain SN15 / ATCC MYA-4574 / FGSC 10173) TaxID=321614 RepID=Q0TY59_PHANO|nr:hypothetical protein SNOG_15691 [Parastagonospora nodorum SN15]EAT77066.1 hypothetical protein SNOG_15691 [Parastagonospora nodorum SN15]